MGLENRFTRFAIVTLVALFATVNVAHAEKLLCQRKKEKKPQDHSVMNLLIVNGNTCPEGFRKLGYLLGSDDIETRSVKGEKGDVGAKGEQGPAGIVNIDACYSKMAQATESSEADLSVYCNNPDTEFVQHLGYSINQSDVAPTTQSLLFWWSDKAYNHPVGGTVHAARQYGSFFVSFISQVFEGGNFFNEEFPDFMLTTTILCCPISGTTQIPTDNQPAA